MGFKVETTKGKGKAVRYVGGGPRFVDGRFLVQLVEKRGKSDGMVVEVERREMTECKAAQFVPVVEQIGEAARYLARYSVAIAKDGSVGINTSIASCAAAANMFESIGCLHTFKN